MDQLVLNLSGLRAERYAKFGAPDEAHGLGGKANPKATIDVVMDDKTTYTLKIGAADANVGYFALSSTLPGAVFVVARPDFQGLVDEGISHFSRNKR